MAPNLDRSLLIARAWTSFKSCLGEVCRFLIDKCTLGYIQVLNPPQRQYPTSSGMLQSCQILYLLATLFPNVYLKRGSKTPFKWRSTVQTLRTIWAERSTCAECTQGIQRGLTCLILCGRRNQQWHADCHVSLVTVNLVQTGSQTQVRSFWNIFYEQEHATELLKQENSGGHCS